MSANELIHIMENGNIIDNIEEPMENIEKSNFRVIGRGIDEKAFFNYCESLSPEEERLIRKFEHPKLEKETAIIQFVNEETNRLMEENGVASYNIPLKNYHLLPLEIIEKIGEGKGSRAAANPMSQRIIIDAGLTRELFIPFGLSTFHETVHLKAFLSIKAKIQERDKKIKKRFYRGGVIIDSFKIHKFCRLDHLPPLERLEYYRYFEGLDEAIVAEMEKRFLKKLLNLPELAKEKEWLMSEEVEKAKKGLMKNGIPEDEIRWIGKGEEDNYYSFNPFPYLPQRKVLNYLCSEIQKEFPDKYQSSDDVFKEFVKSHFTGRLLSISRLIEKTFGKGSFRILGKMNLDKKISFSTLEVLKQIRKT